MAKKTWTEKLATDHGLPQVEPMPAGMLGRRGPGTLLIAAPREYDALMKKVPKGKLTTIDELRAALAAHHGATLTCPLTAGMFVGFAAHAAEEALAAGKVRVTPYWRTLKARGELGVEFPGGLAAVRARLEAEGHQVICRGKRQFVVDYERRLLRPAVE